MNDNRKFNLKLKKLPYSRKQYDHIKTFGVSAEPLPERLVFLSRILNQGQSESCTAYTATAIRESMKGKEYDPELFWQEELKMLGVKDAQGADLETPMAVGVKTGFFPVGQTTPTDKASAYFYVRPLRGEDMFDAIRRTINQMKAPLSGGELWFSEWDNTPQGIIPHTSNNLLGAHDNKIAGFESLNSVDYIVLQGSWGEQFGENGIFRMDRETANRVFTYGVLYWSDDPNIQVQRLGLINSILFNLVSLYKTLINSLQKNGVAPVSKLDLWALAIQQFEGYYPFTASWRNNNPGNLRYSPFMATLGAVKASLAGFCVFPSYQIGFNALKQFLTLCAQRQIIPYHKNNDGTEKPDLTLYDFFNIYAPSSDNNQPKHYAEVVASKIGVPPTTLIKDLI